MPLYLELASTKAVCHKESRGATNPSERESKMIRNFKTLGLLVVAALAVSMVVASAAQAEVKLTAGKTSPLTHTATSLIGTREGTSAGKFL